MSIATVDQAADRSKVLPDRTKLADCVLGCVNQYCRDHEGYGYQAIELFYDGHPLLSAVAHLQWAYPTKLLPEPGQRLWAQLRVCATAFADEDECALFRYLGEFREWLVQHYRVGSDATVPFWNVDARELCLRGTTLVKFSQSGTMPQLILDEFEKRGWPRRIQSPLDFDQLKSAVRELQKKLKGSPIEIARDGTKGGLNWREVSGD